MQRPSCVERSQKNPKRSVGDFLLFYYRSAGPSFPQSYIKSSNDDFIKSLGNEEPTSIVQRKMDPCPPGLKASVNPDIRWILPLPMDGIVCSLSSRWHFKNCARMLIITAPSLFLSTLNLTPIWLLVPRYRWPPVTPTSGGFRHPPWM